MSIGVPTRNRPNELNRLLCQLRNQTYSHLEIIVSNNASDDFLVEQVALRHIQNDTRIKYLKTDTLVSAGRNHTICLNAAHGEYFMWFHDDDEIDSRYVEALVTILHSDTEVALVGGSCDRYKDGHFWYEYHTWDDRSKNKVERLMNLIKQAYVDHASFEQYTYGLFRLKHAPKSFSQDFKAQFFLFFYFAERGSLAHAANARMLKHTTEKEMQAHKDGLAYRRHCILSPFSDQGIHSIQQCAPITLQMISIIFHAQGISGLSKLFLINHCIWYFLRTGIADEKQRLKRFLRSIRCTNSPSN